MFVPCRRVKSARLLTFIVMIAVSFSSGVLAQIPVYRLTDLGTLGGIASYATALNKQGEVVGSSFNQNFDNHAFLWNPQNGMRDLGTMFVPSTAMGINNHSQAVGYSELGGQRPVIWSPNKAVQDLGTLTRFGQGIAWGINDAGLVVGQSSVSTGEPKAVLWNPSARTLRNIDTISGSLGSRAYDINSAQTVVGDVRVPAGSFHAFVWTQQSGMRDLGVLPGSAESAAYAINEQGQVVGHSGYQAMLWTQTGGMRYLGVLSGDTSSIARSINESGLVVGFSGPLFSNGRAMVWHENSGMMDLNDRLISVSDWQLMDAKGINDAGQIVGWGIHHGKYRAYLLNPVPESNETMIIGVLTIIGTLIWHKRGHKRTSYRNSTNSLRV